MRITPLDIRKQRFRKTFRGFDPDQVNSFLEMVSGQFESLVRQNDDLATELKQKQQRIDGYEKIEKTLNEALITAQKTTDEARINAQKESELIIRDAQLRGDRYEQASRQNVAKLESEIASLKTQRDSFLVRFKSMLRDQMSMLEMVSGNIKKGDPASKPENAQTPEKKSPVNVNFVG